MVTAAGVVLENLTLLVRQAAHTFYVAAFSVDKK